MRPKASADIAEARDKGICLKMQYDAAKEAQGMLEMRIAARRGHSNARLIDETHLDISRCLFYLT
jgi:transcription elongation factor GreA